MNTIHISHLDVEGSLFETIVNKQGDNTYEVRQANPHGISFYKGEETVILDKQQAVLLAKAILKNEGIKCD